MAGILTVGLALLCLLMHVFMMKGMRHGKEGDHCDKKENSGSKLK